MELTETCVIEQHIGDLLRSVEPTNLGLGTPDAAVLIVRIVRGWTNDTAMAPKEGQDADVVPPIDLENAHGRALRSTCLEAAKTACPQLAAICAAQWEPCDTRFWQRCGWTVDSTTRGRWQGSRAMEVMFVVGLAFALSKSDELAPSEITRIGLQDDMTFIGSAAALNRSWDTIGPKQVTLRCYKCVVSALGFEQCEVAPHQSTTSTCCHYLAQRHLLPMLELPEVRHSTCMRHTTGHAVNISPSFPATGGDPFIDASKDDNNKYSQCPTANRGRKRSNLGKRKNSFHPRASTMLLSATEPR